MEKEKDQYKIQYASLRPGLQEATIGIDSGSTTTKIVVLDNNHRILTPIITTTTETL